MVTNENFNNEPLDTQENRPDLDRLGDISFFDKLNLELSFLYLRRVAYYSLNFDSTKVDTLRNETEQKSFYDKIYIPVNYEFPAQNKNLDQWGAQHNRDLMVKVATSVLQHFNLNPKVGDIVVVEDQGYKVTELNKENYVAAGIQSLHYILYCSKTNLNELPVELQDKWGF